MSRVAAAPGGRGGAVNTGAGRPRVGVGLRPQPGPEITVAGRFGERYPRKPWLVPLLGSLVAITYMPSLVLWLPKMFY